MDASLRALPPLLGRTVGEEGEEGDVVRARATKARSTWALRVGVEGEASLRLDEEEGERVEESPLAPPLRREEEEGVGPRAEVEGEEEGRLVSCCRLACSCSSSLSWLALSGLASCPLTMPEEKVTLPLGSSVPRMLMLRREGVVVELKRGSSTGGSTTLERKDRLLPTRGTQNHHLISGGVRS